MAKGATSDELREGIEEHLEQTKNQGPTPGADLRAARGEKPKGEKCKGMEGVIKEGSGA